MNPDTMSLDECRNAIAELKYKWKRHVKVPSGISKLMLGDHPLPATINAVAGSLPPGYVWRSVGLARKESDGLDDGWRAHVQDCTRPPDKPFYVTAQHAENEELARARCSLKAWLAVKGNCSE